MKRILCAITAGALLLSLSACKASPLEETVVTEFTVATEEAVIPETTLPEPEPTEEPTQPDILRAERFAAYETVLKTLLTEHTTPDGTQIWFDNSFGDMEKNTFAFADVDGDTKEDLIFWFSTAPMAGMCGWVWSYDAETQEIREELSAFPAQTFFTGGLVQVGMSHNQGFAGDRIWPYTLMGFNPASHSYEVIAQVDAWDKFMAEKDYEGNPYPKDVDTEDAGFVYLITELSGDTYVTTPMSKTQFETEWYPQIFGSAQEIPLVFQELTEENILAACTF